MRILYLGNNWLGWKVLEWLQAQGEEIVGLVIHPENRRKYGDELLASVTPGQTQIFTATELRKADTLQAIQALKPDVALSILFGFILQPSFLSLFPRGVINLHPAYLPYNRGANPNIWSIVENTPAGVTLHYIDPGIDTGDIIAQEQVVVEPVDTGLTLYNKLEMASLALFQRTWPLIRSGQVPRLPQAGEGTFHRVQDVVQLDEINLDQEYIARDLINVLRARTFPPYGGAYFLHEGRKVFLKLELEYEDR
ncbi:MAG: formyl transferase [Ardenticatenaceae bacterium]|nr:formyl transferase [Ardenticatenaceae bacterium]